MVISPPSSSRITSGRSVHTCVKITATIAMVGSANHLGPLSTNGSHSITRFMVPNWALKRIRNITAAATLETM